MVKRDMDISGVVTVCYFFHFHLVFYIYDSGSKLAGHGLLPMGDRHCAISWAYFWASMRADVSSLSFFLKAFSSKARAWRLYPSIFPLRFGRGFLLITVSTSKQLSWWATSYLAASFENRLEQLLKKIPSETMLLFLFIFSFSLAVSQSAQEKNISSPCCSC